MIKSEGIIEIDSPAKIITKFVAKSNAIVHKMLSVVKGAYKTCQIQHTKVVNCNCTH